MGGKNQESSKVNTEITTVFVKQRDVKGEGCV